MDADESRVARLLTRKGLRVEEYTKEDRRKSKTPDFRVFQNDHLVFYCEVKAVSQDDWLDRQLAEAPPVAIVGGARPDPIFNRLSNKIYEATQQFDVVNPDVALPNVLAFVNHDRVCSVADLQSLANALERSYCDKIIKELVKEKYLSCVGVRDCQDRKGKESLYRVADLDKFRIDLL